MLYLLYCQPTLILTARPADDLRHRLLFQNSHSFCFLRDHTEIVPALGKHLRQPLKCSSVWHWLGLLDQLWGQRMYPSAMGFGGVWSKAEMILEVFANLNGSMTLKKPAANPRPRFSKVPCNLKSPHFKAEVLNNFENRAKLIGVELA